MNDTSICHISTVHPGLDGRILFKECASLAAAGYSVSLVINHPKDETIEGVKIIALHPTSNRIYRVLVKPFKALRLALKTKSKVFHFHDPELIFIGIILKLLGKKVIYDMHELVYHQIHDKEWIGSVRTRKFIAGFYLFFEKIAVRLYDKIILAEDGYLPYVEQNYNSQKSKFVTVRNYFKSDLLDNINPKKEATNTTVAIYAGGLTKLRGIKEIIQAINQVEDTALWLLGGWENESYERECLGEDHNNRVKYLGKKKMTEVYPYLLQADIGMAILYPLENYLTSLPVKAFEYMACGLPIIMSDFPYWKKTFAECALFSDPKNPDQIAKNITQLMRNKNHRKEMGERGKKLVHEKYSWKFESKKLIQIYNELTIKK